MEVVLLVVAVIGIALLVVPRLRRKRKPRVRRSMHSVKAARRRAAVAASAPVAVSTWTPSGSAPGAASDDDGWEDDLGWEGEANPEPETREAWQRWRETESPLASAAAAEPVEAPAELPSVERWRAAASTNDTDWLDDDDGLGWEGEEVHSTPRVWIPEHPVVTAPEVAPLVENGREWATNGNGHAVAAPAPAATPRKRRLHPVLLVALYAAVGIGAVVLGSTVLFGNSSAPSPSDPQPASNTTPKAAPTADPELTGTLADETSDGEFKLNVDPDTKATAAARKARRDFRRERSRTLAAERRDVASKAAAARRRAAAERAAAEQRQQSGGGGTGGSAPTTQQGGGGGGGGNPAPNPAPRPRPTCEFCIG